MKVFIRYRREAPDQDIARVFARSVFWRLASRCFSTRILKQARSGAVESTTSFGPGVKAAFDWLDEWERKLALHSSNSRAVS